MKPRTTRFNFFTQPMRDSIAGLCILSLASSSFLAFGQAATPVIASPDAASTQEWKLPADQLDSLVAPIALYADPLLSQTLVASTYPLEIIQLQQWLANNENLKDKALADAVANQNWDPSIQSLVAVPDVMERMADNIQWTTELGNAFLAQPDDVMTAVQRMRAKAVEKQVLVSNDEQMVKTTNEIIVIEQANPQVIYVPSYDPVVVYGPPVYPYPTYVYPGYVPGRALAFGVGIALGIAWGGGWGYNCGWHKGGGNINININNNYVRHYNKNNNIKGGQGGKWKHRPAHRGGAPYGKGGINGVGGGTRPSVGRPGGSRPGVGKPGGTGPGVGKPGVGKPGVGKPGVGKPGVGKPGVGKPGVGKPGGTRPGGATKPATRPTTKPATRPTTKPATKPATRPTTRPATRPTTKPSSIGNRSVSPRPTQTPNKSAFRGSSSSRSSSQRSSSRGSSSRGGGRR